jgi:hypothetical protein
MRLLRIEVMEYKDISIQNVDMFMDKYQAEKKDGDTVNPNRYIFTSQTRKLDKNQSSSTAHKFHMPTQLNILV